MKKVKISISGMHCASCASNIERSIRKISGVKSVSVNLLMKKGIIEAEDSVSDEELRKAVERTGYKVAAIEK